MILVGIMLVTDLIMVAIVAAVYGGKTKYQSGMILGIHLPKEVISQPEVVELTQKYKRNSRYFYILNLMLGCVVCPLGFWYTSILMIVWSIWFFEFIFGSMKILYSAHRKLYEIKIKNGWGQNPAGLAESSVPDEDYYWRKGWYENPEDPHFWVQDRYSSTNYSLNIGRKGGKIFLAVITIGTLSLFIWMCVMFVRMDFTPVCLKIDAEHVKITSGYTGAEFDKDEIEEIKLIEKLPDEKFVRTNGSADGNQWLGKFRGSKSGVCRMYVWLKETPIIEIKTDKYTIFINSKEDGQTEKWYEKLN